LLLMILSKWYTPVVYAVALEKNSRTINTVTDG